MNRYMKIGILDSGVGGLVTGRAIRNLLPQYDYLYYGDTKNMPYGQKSKDEIFSFVKKGVEFLLERNCALVVIACNTGSVNALRKIQQGLIVEKYKDRRVLGVIIPTVEEILNSKSIGVLATRATVDSHIFRVEIEKINPYAKVVEQSAKDLASLIQEGKIKEAIEDAEKYLKILATEDIDTLILGCTHYPVIKKEIKEIAKKVFLHEVKIISQDEIIPQKLQEYLSKHKEIEERLSQKNSFEIELTEKNDYINSLVKAWFWD